MIEDHIKHINYTGGYIKKLKMFKIYCIYFIDNTCIIVYNNTNMQCGIG